MQKITFYLLLLLATVSLASCSETEEEEQEFSDWQNKNELYWSNLYSKTQTLIQQGDTTWKIIPNWGIDGLIPTTGTTHTFDQKQYIIVHVLEEGKGSGCPLYTDSVKVHYQGRYIPSKTYTDGYIFDQSYSGTFSTLTAKPTSLLVSGCVEGFTTALMKMHIGDHWMVYIPYNQGYGTTADQTSGIPGFSNLIFDLRLVGYYH